MLTYTQWEQGKITSFHKFWELNSFWKFFVCLSFLKSIGILQAEILERIAMPSSMGSPQPRDQTQVSCIADRFFTIWASRKVHIYTHTHIHMYIYVYIYIEMCVYSICVCIYTHTHTHTKYNKREELLPSWLNFLNVTLWKNNNIYTEIFIPKKSKTFLMWI